MDLKSFFFGFQVSVQKEKNTEGKEEDEEEKKFMLEDYKIKTTYVHE